MNRILIMLAAIVLASCGPLIPDLKDKAQSILLRPIALAADVSQMPLIHASLVIPPPLATSGFNTDRVLLLKNGLYLDNFANVKWPDTLPLMVQSLLVESFENTGKIVSVGGDSSNIDADYFLITEIRGFDAEYANGTGAGLAPVIHVKIVAKLLKFPERLVAATYVAEVNVPVAVNHMGDVVDGFNKAFAQAETQIVTSVLQELSTRSNSPHSH